VRRISSGELPVPTALVRLSTDACRDHTFRSPIRHITDFGVGSFSSFLSSVGARPPLHVVLPPTTRTNPVPEFGFR